VTPQVVSEQSCHCSERRRLSRNVAEAISEIYALKDRQTGKKDVTLPLRMEQAKMAWRNAERALHDHVKEHGCAEWLSTKAKR